MESDNVINLPLSAEGRTATLSTGFLQESPGVQSNTRLMVTILITYGVLSSLATLIVGLIMYYQSKEALAIVVTTSGGNISTIAGVAQAWKLMQKQQEVKRENLLLPAINNSQTDKHGGA